MAAVFRCCLLGTEVEGANGTYTPMGAPRISYASPPYSGALAPQACGCKKLEGKRGTEARDTALAARHQRDDQVLQGRHLAGDEGRLQRLPAGARHRIRAGSPRSSPKRHRKSASALRSSASRNSNRASLTWRGGRCGRPAVSLLRLSSSIRAACMRRGGMAPPTGDRRLRSRVAKGLRRARSRSTASKLPRSRKATVHALLGENGAGKSTIVKLLSGLMRPDSGPDRDPRHSAPSLDSPRAAHAFGIQTAFQEMTLVQGPDGARQHAPPELRAGRPALAMIRAAYGGERGRGPFRCARPIEVDLRDEVGDLDLAVQQKIEIARAIYREAEHPAPRRADIEPGRPRRRLAGRDHRPPQGAKGVTVVFISHRLREVRAFCDHMTVLRNGRHIATGATSPKFQRRAKSSR